MGIFLLIVSVLVFAVLVAVTAMHPTRPRQSLAELKRRLKKSEVVAVELDRHELHAAMTTLLRSIRAVLLVLLVCLLIGALGWGWGIATSIIVAVIYPGLARIGVVLKWGRLLYTRIEPRLLDVAAKFEKLFHGLREPTQEIHAMPLQFHSRDELAETIERSGEVLSDKERGLLASALVFSDKTVDSVMTPRSVIDFIQQSEFLGPLVLDELHALGHSRLPVINKDLDHVVGVLHLRDLLSLDIKRSVTAEKAMEKKVYYIHEDDTLEHALSAFLRTRHHLFIVINQNRETVGLLTIEDVIETLIGRRIVDEDDIHADLRAVAAREGKSNNTAPGHVDL